MKIMVDYKPNYCEECLFGKSGKQCSVLLQDLNEKYPTWRCEVYYD
jgi:hypothetical protein